MTFNFLDQNLISSQIKLRIKLQFYVFLIEKIKLLRIFYDYSFDLLYITKTFLKIDFLYFYIFLFFSILKKILVNFIKILVKLKNK